MDTTLNITLSAMALALLLAAGTAEAADLKGNELPIGAKSIIAPKAERTEPGASASAGADKPRQIVVEESSKAPAVERIQLAKGEEAAPAPKLLAEPAPLADAEETAPIAKAAEAHANESAPEAPTEAAPVPAEPKTEAPVHSKPKFHSQGYGYATYQRPSYAYSTSGFSHGYSSGYGSSYDGGDSYGYGDSDDYDHCD